MPKKIQIKTLPKQPSIDPTKAAETTSRRALIAGIAAAIITVVGGIVVALINGWFGIRKPNAIADTGIYRVRVTAIDSRNVPVEDAKVWSSMGGEPKKVSGGWQFDIPRASKRQDGQLSIFAFRESDALSGRTDLVLSTDYNPSITVKLVADYSASVRGVVVDGNNRTITGARVFVVGYDNDVIITKEGGNFDLPAHAAVGQMINLHAEKAGYQAVTQEHPVGNHPATLVLEIIK